MDLEKAGLVICITLFVVIGFNALIYLSVSRGDTAGSIELFRRATQRVRDPWKPEDDALEELSRLVSELKGEPLEPTEQDDEQEH